MWSMLVQDMHSKGLSYYRRFFPWEAEGIHTGEASLQFVLKVHCISTSTRLRPCPLHVAQPQVLFESQHAKTNTSHAPRCPLRVHFSKPGFVYFRLVSCTLFVFSCRTLCLVQRFISRWLQPIEKAEWEEILKFEDAHGQSYDCMNVFQKFKSRTEKVCQMLECMLGKERTL